MDVLIRAVQRAGSSTYIAVNQGKSNFTYNRLLNSADALGKSFGAVLSKRFTDSHAPRVGCLCDPGAEYVASMWSSWLQGCIFVPFAPSHPKPLLEYEMDDARLSTVRAPNLGRATLACLHVCAQHAT